MQGRASRWVTLLLLVTLGPSAALIAAADALDRPVRVRPAMLAPNIELFAGRPVDVSGARVVGMFGPRVMVIDTATRWLLPPGRRDRLVVLIHDGEVRVRPELLVGSTVRVVGVARTVLGARLTAEVPWPVELDPDRIERLDIRGVVLATSVQTAEGIELTSRLTGP